MSNKELDSGKGRKLPRGARYIACLTAGALFLSGCSVGRHTSSDEAASEMIADFQEAYTAAPPVGKYALEFLMQEKKVVPQYPDANSGAGPVDDKSGHAQDPTHLQWSVTINNGCLGNTAYDVTGGKIQGRVYWTGLFSGGSAEISGNTPTASAFAQVNPDNVNQLFVVPGNPSSPKLVFNGLESGVELDPADKATKNILETYGCTTGPSSVAVGELIRPQN